MIHGDASAFSTYVHVLFWTGVLFSTSVFVSKKTTFLFGPLSDLRLFLVLFCGQLGSMKCGWWITTYYQIQLFMFLFFVSVLLLPSCTIVSYLHVAVSFISLIFPFDFFLSYCSYSFPKYSEYSSGLCFSRSLFPSDLSTVLRHCVYILFVSIVFIECLWLLEVCL